MQVYDSNNELKDITGVHCNGETSVYEVQFEDGKVYQFTENHKLKVKTAAGFRWKKVKNIKPEDEIKAW